MNRLYRVKYIPTVSNSKALPGAKMPVTCHVVAANIMEAVTILNGKALCILAVVDKGEAIFCPSVKRGE